MSPYDSLYTLLMTHLYGVVDVSLLSPDQTLTLTILSTAGAVFVAVLPFILVWQVIKLFR